MTGETLALKGYVASVRGRRLLSGEHRKAINVEAVAKEFFRVGYRMGRDAERAQINAIVNAVKTEALKEIVQQPVLWGVSFQTCLKMQKTAKETLERFENGE